MNYPSTFCIAHRIFHTLKGKPWGDITDGPVGADEMLDCVIESFKGEDAPTVDGFRAFLIADGQAHDITLATIARYKKAME